MSELRNRIELLNRDYQSVTGRAFEYFFCPIVFMDEETELCKAHIVNQAFPNPDMSERTWTVQRKDVDNFYGSMFEADFVDLKYKGMPITGNVFVNKELYRQLRPNILLDGQAVDHFIFRGDLPPNTSLLRVEDSDQFVDIGIKMPPEDFQMAIEEAVWEIAGLKDVRLQALVSLIKAAHLTLFELFGYHYALSATGRFIGYDILGKFFLQNRGGKKKTVLENAREFFAEFVHMARPAQLVDVRLEGSIYDKTLLMCRKHNGMPWAWIVFVKATDTLNAVLIPICHHPNAIHAFLQFLDNQQEVIEVSTCSLTDEGLEVDPKQLPLTWTKAGDFSLKLPPSTEP